MPLTQLGIEPATLRLIAQCFNYWCNCIGGGVGVGGCCHRLTISRDPHVVTSADIIQ